MNSPTSKWRKIAEEYKHFAVGWDNLDFSERAAVDMFNYESTGSPKVSYYDPYLEGKYNGFAVGKHWMDVTHTMWREDISAGLLTKGEILEDESLGDFSKSVVVNLKQGRHVLAENLRPIKLGFWAKLKKIFIRLVKRLKF